MFDRVTRTWNPITGCCHDCVYCWARRLATARLCKVFPQYYDPEFKPKLIPERLNVSFKPRELVFVCDMGDLLCREVPDSWVLKVFNVIARYPRTDFLILTKNPIRLYSIMSINESLILPNMILGTTVETNNDELYVRYGISKARPPTERLRDLCLVLEQVYSRLGRRQRAWISIEPIIDFTSPNRFAELIIDAVRYADKTIIYVGYDNYGILKKLGIPEPPIEKTLELIDVLKQHGVEVRPKGRKLMQTLNMRR